jgi:hypothetical protein
MSSINGASQGDVGWLLQPVGPTISYVWQVRIG